MPILKREWLNNKNSYKKTTFWAEKMKDSYTDCKEHLSCQNTWRGKKYKGKDSRISWKKKKKKKKGKAKIEISHKIWKDAVLSYTCSLNFSMSITRRHTSENSTQILELLFSLIVCLEKEEERFLKVENKNEKITKKTNQWTLRSRMKKWDSSY